jgi:tetratricopeptide (TPR) repeat protein
MSKKKKMPLVARPQPVVVAENLESHHRETGHSFFDHAWLPVLVLVAATVATYLGSLGNGFVAFDDDKSIWYNEYIKHPTFSGIFGAQSLGMYAPVTILGYTVVYQLFGENAPAFHVAGLLVHLLNVVLAYYLMLRIQDRTWAAFFVALMFGVHPMLVEPVSWVSGLSTPIFSCFYLVSLHLFLSYLDGKGPKFYWLALLVFILSGLSKSAAATLPLMLVALDWWRSGKLDRDTFISKWPFWLISIGLVGATFLTRSAAGHDVGSTDAFSIVDRVFMISQTLFFYPVKLLVPFDYSISYSFIKTAGAWRFDYYLALPALALLGWWLFKYWNKQREITLGLAMYALPLCLMLPVVSVGTFEMRSDRYAYLPSLGIFFLLMLLVEKIKSPALRYGLLAGLAALFSFQAMQQSKVWKDGTALFKNCVDKTPKEALCQCNLGYSELLSLQFDASIEHYTNTLALDKSYVEAYNGRGQAYLSVNKIPEALDDFTKAIEAGIVTPKLFFNRGKCLAMLSRFADALPDLSKSIELEPKSAETWYFRAFSHEKTASLDNAFRDYSKAIELNPNYVEALVNRGLLYYNAQQYQESIADNTTALNISSAGIKPMILVNRANALLQSGKLPEALADVNNALQLNPNYPRAYKSRAAIYQKLGQAEKAQEDLQRAGQ